MKKLIVYIFLSLLGILMIYPLVWLFFSSFKPNNEIFNTVKLLPSKLYLDSYIQGWKGTGQIGFHNFYVNTFKLVVPTVFFTIISSAIAAYGFARFTFPFKKLLFLLMISTLMLPNAVIIIPCFILFRNFHWIDTYLPFIVPAAFAGEAFFIFMMIQFLRGIPKELDESAVIDGCNSFTILVKVLLPLCKPALFSIGIFKFMWTWNDFFNPLIYINSVNKYTISLGLKMSIDIADAVKWSNVFAMSLLSLIPGVLLFFFAQKYFVEGITTTGLKG